MPSRALRHAADADAWFDFAAICRAVLALIDDAAAAADIVIWHRKYSNHHIR